MSYSPEIPYKLKGYVYFNAVEDGVFFQGRESAFVLKGNKIYPLVAKIISLMDAGHPYQHIHSKLPEQFKIFFEKMFNQLNSHHMLMQHDLFDSVIQEYQAFPELSGLLNYLQEHLGDFTNQFNHWRETKVRVIGEGYALKSAVETLCSSGLKLLEVIYHSEKTAVPDYFEIEDVLSNARGKLSDFSYEIYQLDRVTDEMLQNQDYLLLCYQTLDQKTVPDFLRQSNVVFLATGLLNGHAIISPIAEKNTADLFDLQEQIISTKSTNQSAYSPVAMSLLGNIAALNIIKNFFGIEKQLIANYATSVSEHLDISRHHVLPVVTGDLYQQSVTTHFESEFEVPKDRELALYEQLKINLAPLFDPLFGCFDQSLSQQMKQVPLFHEALTVRFPHRFNRNNVEIVSWGFDAESAGCRVLSHGLSLRTSQLSDLQAHMICTAFDYNQWLAKATAIALVYSQSFSDSALSLIVDPNQVDDSEVQLLSRFLTLYFNQSIEFELFFHPEGNAFLVRASQQGTVISIAIEASPIDALKEAMGMAYCQKQFPDISNSLHPIGQLDLTAAQSNRNHQQDTKSIFNHATRILPNELSVTPYLLNTSIANELIFTGYVLLDSKE